MRKTSKSRRGFIDGLLRFVPLFVLFSLILNVFVVYRFETQRKPQVVYSVERVSAPSNTIEKSKTDIGRVIPDQPKFPVSQGSSSSTENRTHTNSVPRVVATAWYDYFTMDIGRGVYMWDRYFSEGSPTSYGRILRIYPDRILLEDGSFIDNSKWRGGVSTSRPVQNKMEVIAND